MLGVSNPAEESVKPTKAKQQSKKNAEKRAGKQDLSLEPTSVQQPLPPLKIRAKLSSPAILKHETAVVETPVHSSSGTITSFASHQLSIPEVSRGLTAPVPASLSGYAQSAKAPKRKSGVNQERENAHVVLYDTPSLASPAVAVQVPYKGNATFDRVSQDDDDEDVCPVCDFECTCNGSGGGAMDIAPSPLWPTPVIEDPHTVTAIKVPFQPNVGLNAAGTQRSLGVERPPFLDAEKRPVITKEAFHQDDAFRTSAKNPMSTPVSQRRLSVMRLGGKGLGKAPYLVHGDKGQYESHSCGKSFKSGKAVMRFYQRSGASSGSDTSDEFSDANSAEDIESQGGDFPHLSEGKAFARSRARYESDSNDPGSVEDALSLSDYDGSNAQPSSDGMEQKNRYSAGKRISLSRAPVYSRTDQGSEHAGENMIAVKKRGPGRPRKNRDPLIASREDEMTLYTPAVATRKLTAMFSPKAESSKPARPSNKLKAQADLPVIAFDREVAQDVMALNAHESESGKDSRAAGSNTESQMSERAPSVSFSENDLFGDGDLSDELSGDLSDIMSDDFEEFSEDGLDFCSSDEEDETSSSSSPREFHYSEMEEQDESLVDSDSSINSVTTSNSGSSDSSTDSDNENEPYPREISDDEDEVLEFEQDDSGELIDEEELMRLAEQERLYLARAHGLLDVLSEEDSDPDRNPFESSEDEDEEEDERVFDGDEEDYSEDYYEDDDYGDEYDDMDEQEVLERLKGVQPDIHALMMIPPEQQEQLLLLQHYEETHRQQQELLVLQQQQQQSSPSSMALEPQVSQQSAHINGLLTGSGLLPQFDINVTDLDAVSEQLAASLASSIAESMAGSMAAKDGALFSEGLDGDDIAVDAVDAANRPEVILIAPNASPASVSPEEPAVAWVSPASSSSSSLNANTSTPPGTTAETSPSLSGPSGSSKTQIVGKIETLANSPSYRPLTSIVASSTIGGRPVQPILPKLAPGETLPGLDRSSKSHTPESQLVMLNQSRLQTGDVFKEAAQKALAVLGNKKGSQNAKQGSTATLDELIITGDTTDEASPDMHSPDLRKRKIDDDKGKELVTAQGKRRRLSTVDARSKSRAPGFVSVPTPESELSLLPSPIGSPPSTLSLSLAPLKPPSPLDIAGLSSSSSLVVTPTAEVVATAAFDFSKATMPFIDPSAKIVMPSSSTTVQRRGSASSQHIVRGRKHSLKGKDPKVADVMPMDDLLDTSALYGRSSSRSPSPDRAETAEDEANKSALKDLNRWERVPIGTFRRSRRPSSPYVGLQGALKFGNVTMPATLLADHQQHQQQLHQESHRLHKRVPGVGKRRSSSSASDLTRPLQGKSSNPRTPRSMAAPSLSDILTGVDLESSLDSHHLRRGSSINGGLHRSQSSLGLLEGSLLSTLPTPGVSGSIPRDPLRRRRRAGSHGTSHMHRAGARSTGHLSKWVASGLNVNHPGLGMGLQTLAGPSNPLAISSSVSGSLSSSSSVFPKNGGGVLAVAVTGDVAGTSAALAELRDLMTDSSQLPSSACPTPLHSPLFSATAASGRMHHHSSGEPVVVVERDRAGKATAVDSLNDLESRGEETIVSHLELDIGKEMDGFHERLLAQSQSQAVEERGDK
ncbi:hypothetical protein EDD11_000374 [Mortierella claussenii]|nr:hypothetical protein EDD11_000374 [Mortierella claussenii]